MPKQKEMDKRLLDRIAASRAQTIVDEAVKSQEPKDVDNLVTKALGVLQENGVFACFLFLFSRTQDKEKEIAKVLRKEMLALAAHDLPFDWERLSPEEAKGSQTVLARVSETICADLDPLLMTKELFEQTLIYARYGAKARKNEGK